ncbi:MAG: OsmC family peroxiredoxin [Paeniglutamicibacter terrestris]|uniref:OsmC family peroxiredoxin n=1 Tax=Paeniglutamicibacter terrestris TaxID=2723403 RepID=A0ABX1G8Z2_9MICC|nr:MULTISPECIES: OsmC family peroxiredoxin [Paeniglutamicibacter]ASN38947.1 peroxiredoxin [Arthrobacter sp. 7749]NKG22464.1 OsmC family peroxiredoxin [Paeniglutamicibacter terrestris]QXQ11576.1 OsmC family peroxiredoxin [Paeniglutamicibacter sp. Y32M11]
MAVTTRSASTVWTGDLASGSGETTFETSGIGTFPVTWRARTEAAEGKTSPEELIAAAHASCFSMALSNILKQAGHVADKLETSAAVDFDTSDGAKISAIRLTLKATIPGLEDAEFQKLALSAKEGCPVSAALAAVPSITLDASLT